MKVLDLLRPYPDDRLEFLYDDAMILEEAWPGFAADPPGGVTVRVKDGPGDERRRGLGGQQPKVFSTYRI